MVYKDFGDLEKDLRYYMALDEQRYHIEQKLAVVKQRLGRINQISNYLTFKQIFQQCLPEHSQIKNSEMKDLYADMLRQSKTMSLLFIERFQLSQKPSPKFTQAAFECLIKDNPLDLYDHIEVLTPKQVQELYDRYAEYILRQTFITVMELENYITVFRNYLTLDISDKIANYIIERNLTFYAAMAIKKIREFALEDRISEEAKAKIDGVLLAAKLSGRLPHYMEEELKQC